MFCFGRECLVAHLLAGCCHLASPCLVFNGWQSFRSTLRELCCRLRAGPESLCVHAPPQLKAEDSSAAADLLQLLQSAAQVHAAALAHARSAGIEVPEQALLGGATAAKSGAPAAPLRWDDYAALDAQDWDWEQEGEGARMPSRTWVDLMRHCHCRHQDVASRSKSIPDGMSPKFISNLMLPRCCFVH